MMDNQNQQAIDRLSQELHSLALSNRAILERLETQDAALRSIAAQKPAGKDIWDRLSSLAPIASALIIACTGAYFTYTYNQQQIKLQEIQTIEKFLPHLVGDEKSKRAAVLAMNSLGNTKLAAKVASIFASEGTVSALSSMAKNEDSQDKELIREALYKTLDALAEKYKYENNYQNAEQTYRKALQLKEAMVGKDSPELTDSLDRLADLCDAHGDHTSAQEARARAAAIKRRNAIDINAAASPKAAVEDQPASDTAKAPGADQESAQSPDSAAKRELSEQPDVLVK